MSENQQSDIAVNLADALRVNSLGANRISNETTLSLLRMMGVDELRPWDYFVNVNLIGESTAKVGPLLLPVRAQFSSILRIDAAAALYVALGRLFTQDDTEPAVRDLWNDRVAFAAGVLADEPVYGHDMEATFREVTPEDIIRDRDREQPPAPTESDPCLPCCPHEAHTEHLCTDPAAHAEGAHDL